MADHERFENLDNILRGWAKGKVHKPLAEALIGSRSGKNKDSEKKKKNAQTVSVGSRARLNQTQNWCW